MMVNGVALSSMIAGGWGGGAVPNATGTAEFAIDVSGVDAQAATGGVRINFIPRDGGNRFSGTIFGSLRTESFAADNFTGTDVQQRGLTAPGTIKGNGDFNPGVGGPIERDKVWFFLSGRYLYADNFVAGMFFNENANKLNEFRYVSDRRAGDPAPGPADASRPGSPSRRTSENKFGVTYDQEALLRLPESDRRRRSRPRPRSTADSRCSASSRPTGTSRSATGCCSRRAPSTASSAGAACTCRPARATTSTRSRRAWSRSSTTRRSSPAQA